MKKWYKKTWLLWRGTRYRKEAVRGSAANNFLEFSEVEKAYQCQIFGAPKELFRWKAVRKAFKSPSKSVRFDEIFGKSIE